MDTKRLQELCGLNESIVTPVNVLDSQNITNKNNAKVYKSNNDVPKSKSAEQVRLDNETSKIDNNVVATLDDTDDVGLKVKQGKKDVNGVKVVSDGEMLTNTISITDKGEPKIDKNTKVIKKNVEQWGESVEIGTVGFYAIKEGKDGKDQYVIQSSNDVIEYTLNKSQATVFESQEDIFNIIDKLAEHQVFQITMEACSKSMKNEDEETTDKDAKEKSEVEDEVDEEELIKETVGDYSSTVETVVGMLRTGQDVKVALNVDGKPFMGYVNSITDRTITVKPSTRTIQQFQLASPQPQLLTIAGNKLRFNDQGILLGHATVGSNNSKLSLDPIYKDKTLSRDKPPVDMASGYKTTSVKGDPSNSNTWGIMDGAKVVGNGLMERFKAVLSEKKK